MARTLRGNVAICSVVLAALLFLPQMRDMLANISDYSALHWGAGLAYHASLLFFAFSAWYWSRTILAARFHIDDDQGPGGGSKRSANGLPVNTTAFARVPRFLFVAIAVCGGVVALKSADWVDFLITAGWAFPVYLLLVGRRGLRDSFKGGPKPRPRGGVPA